MKLEIFTDYSCPFCYIGFKIVERLVQDFDLEVYHRPLILSPNEPISGSDLKEHVAEETIRAGYKRIDQMAREYGLVYNNRYRRFNTNRLHQATLYAQEESRYMEFSDQAFRAIFERGENVGLEEVINRLALDSGLDPAAMNREIDSGRFEGEVHRAYRQAEDYKVSSVPTFILNNRKTNLYVTEYSKFKEIFQSYLDQ